MRILILITALVSVTLFGSGFILSYVNPTFVESIARKVIRIEVERRVGERLTALENNKIVKFAERLSGRNAMEIADLKRKMAEGLPQKVAAVAAEMRNVDCECRKAIEKTITGIFEDRVAGLSHLNERLGLLIRTKYMEVAESLTREFRIFTGANTIMFAFLGITAALRRGAGLQLVLPTIVLLGAAGIVGYLYLFNQDWLHAILFGDYVGLGYFTYLGAATACLADIAFNRARVTTRIVNAALNAVGSAITAVPC
jgi:hypothetical protein